MAQHCYPDDCGAPEATCAPAGSAATLPPSPEPVIEEPIIEEPEPVIEEPEPVIEIPKPVVKVAKKPKGPPKARYFNL